MIMYITSHTILIYYNNYYYDNSNHYLFLLLLRCCMSMYACMCCAVLSLSCVCVCVVSCVSSHMLIHVYLCVFTPPHPPGLCCSEEAGVLVYRGYISGKNFYKIWKMGIPGKNRPQEHF